MKPGSIEHWVLVALAQQTQPIGAYELSRAVYPPLRLPQICAACSRMRAKGMPVETTQGPGAKALYYLRTDKLPEWAIGVEASKTWWYVLPGEFAARACRRVGNSKPITQREAVAEILAEHALLPERLWPFDPKRDTFPAGVQRP